MSLASFGNHVKQRDFLCKPRVSSTLLQGEEMKQLNLSFLHRCSFCPLVNNTAMNALRMPPGCVSGSFSRILCIQRKWLGPGTGVSSPGPSRRPPRLDTPGPAGRPSRAGAQSALPPAACPRSPYVPAYVKWSDVNTVCPSDG